MIGRFMEEFAGRGVVDFGPEAKVQRPDSEAYRLGFGGKRWDGSFEDDLVRLLADPGASTVEALVIGSFSGEGFDPQAGPGAARLIEVAPQLPALEALFFGDITYEVCELSWIEQTDVAPLMMAFPRLRVFGVRGGNGLRFSGLEHARLEELVAQTGGMSGACVRQIASASLPALRRLELWLGEEGYGLTASAQDLVPILSGKLFPQLSSLGLKNCEFADELAWALSMAPVVEQLEELDLSMGTLSDEAALAFLQCPMAKGLRLLDLSENLVTEEAGAALERALRGVEVRWATSKHDDERYVTHGE